MKTKSPKDYTAHVIEHTVDRKFKNAMFRIGESEYRVESRCNGYAVCYRMELRRWAWTKVTVRGDFARALVKAFNEVMAEDGIVYRAA